MQHIQQTVRAIRAAGPSLVMALLLLLAGCGPGANSETTRIGSAAAQTGTLADIVVPEQYDSLLPGANGVEMSTSMSVAELASFFEDRMPSKGWELSAPVVPKTNSAVMHFEQGGRSAAVHIRRPPGRDATLV